MILNTFYHTVVVRQDFTAEWVCSAYTFKHGIVSAGRNVIKACVSFSDNRFPNQNLSGISVCDAVCVAFILRLPACRNTSTVAVLQDTTDKQANVIAGNRSVRADVIKEVLVLFGEHISKELWDNLLNTYSMSSYEEMWKSFDLCLCLFKKISKKVADSLGYNYPDYDENVTKYLETQKRISNKYLYGNRY